MTEPPTPPGYPTPDPMDGRRWWQKRWVQASIGGGIALIVLFGIIGSLTKAPDTTPVSVMPSASPPTTEVFTPADTTSSEPPPTTSEPAPTTTPPPVVVTTAAPVTTYVAPPPPPPPAPNTPAAQRRTVTPGAYCADADAGEIGYSAAGNEYRCSLYPNGRYRWKRV